MKKNIKEALAGLNATETPQSLPIPGRDMVANNAGGFVFKLDEWKQLDRFLILGSEGGTFYVSEKKLTAENANKVLLLLQKDGLKVVAKTVEMLTSGRAPKPDTAIFVLALAAAKGDDATRKAALAAVPSALKTGTQLLKFVDTVNELRGWGRGLKKAIQLWFKERKAETLALQLVKYKQREGWSMKDVLRLAKPVPADDVQGKLFGWTAKKDDAAWAKAPVAPAVAQTGGGSARPAPARPPTARPVHKLSGPVGARCACKLLISLVTYTQLTECVSHDHHYVKWISVCACRFACFLCSASAKRSFCG